MMNGSARPRAGRALPLIFCFALAITVAWLETARSPGFNPTAAVYVDAARHLAEGKGVSTSVLVATSVPTIPSPLSVWAPGYPAIIAGVARVGVDVPVAARVTALGAFALSVVVVWLLGAALFGRRVAAVSALLVAVWPAMTRVASVAWSESTFVLFLLVSVLITTKALGRRGVSGLVVAGAGGLAMGLAALTRYAAIPLIPVGAAALLVIPRPTRWDVRAVQAVVWGTAAGIPTAGWLARNLALTGAVIGPGRQTDDLGVFVHVVSALRAIGSDLLGLLSRALILPEWWAVPAETMLGVAAVLVGLPLVVFLRRPEGRAAFAEVLRETLRSPAVLFTATIVLGYWGAMIVARSVIGFYPLGSRLMMPVHPLAVTILVGAAMALVDRAWPAAARVVVALVVTASVASSALVVLPASVAAGGPRLAPPRAPAWVEWVDQHTPPDALIVGNLAFDYNLYLGRSVVQFTSNRYGISRFDCGAVSGLLQRLEAEHVYLVLHEERGRFDPHFIGTLYGEALERLLEGNTRFPFRPAVRRPNLAVFEVLNGDWPCD